LISVFSKVKHKVFQRRAVPTARQVVGTLKAGRSTQVSCLNIQRRPFNEYRIALMGLRYLTAKRK
jgi:hypothetical protein